MEWLERMNRAIDYIEENLTGEIELSEAARMACCSSYQFQRMFSFITDVTLAEYIRRRRLTLANGDVKRLEACTGDLPSFVSQDLYPVHAVCSYRITGPDTFPYMLCAFKEGAIERLRANG